MPDLQFVSLSSGYPHLMTTLARIWNNACGKDFSVSERLFSYNLTPTPGGMQAGRLAILDGQAVGFVSASLLDSQPQVNAAYAGWLDALVVDRAFQRQGIGKALLAWAEDWLRLNGCRTVRLAGSLRPFAAGLPEAFHSEAFFVRRGYQMRPKGSIEWDVARDLNDGRPIARQPSPALEVIHPCRGEEKDDLLDFFKRSFPGRWLYEVELLLSDGGRLQDILVASIQGKVEGFCWVTLPDSIRPLDRYFMQRLPRPWGQLGPIGVSQAVRGQGLGGLLLQEGLLHLQRQGVHGCVIDWTDLLDFYGKYGFSPYTKYLMMIKSLPELEPETRSQETP